VQLARKAASKTVPNHFELKGNWQVAHDATILALSVYVLLQLAIEVITDPPSSVTLVLEFIDFGICIIFLADWAIFFVAAGDKWDYTKRRIVDLIASIPFLQVLRPFRIFRIVRLVRVLRFVRGMKAIRPVLGFLARNRARSAFVLYLMITIVVYFYCSIGLYNFEKGVNQQIHGFGDILWMSFTTLTTVGYGDLYPITTGGRLMAGVLILTGFGLFGLLTAEFAAFILKRVKGEEKSK
jgi:voltage-gated potassium channel